MVRASRLSLPLALLLLQAASWWQFASAEIKKPTQLPPAVLSDIKYIRCDVCKLMAKHAYSTVVQMRRELGKKKKVRV